MNAHFTLAPPFLVSPVSRGRSFSTLMDPSRLSNLTHFSPVLDALNLQNPKSLKHMLIACSLKIRYSNS